MAVRLLRSAFTLPRPPAEVFPFFADARNLEAITPPELRFRILAPTAAPVREGALLDYRLRLHGMPLRWRSLISHWEPPHAFVDQMVRGPYAYWHHLHRFIAVPGGTRCEDLVHWRLPFEPFAGVCAPLIRRQLRRIFEHREDAIRGAFGAPRAAGEARGAIEFALA